MKKSIILTVLLFSLLLTAYDSSVSSASARTAVPSAAVTGDFASDDSETVKYDKVCVDVRTNEDGFYSLASDVEIHYCNDNIESISVNEPTLYAFRVSSAYKGGVWLMDLEKGQHVLDELSAAAVSLRASEENELAEKIENLIEIISQTGPFTQAST
ncbi:MAG: hypothetical protein ACI4D3_13970 [Lachnospiraceae bacterium]